MLTEPYRFSKHKVTVYVPHINEPIYIFPLSDVHRYCSFHAQGEFNRFLSRTKDMIAAGLQVYFILLGDEIEGITRTERNALRNAELHEGTVVKVANMYQQEMDDFLSSIDFMAGRILFNIEGNHRGIVKYKNGAWKDGTDYLVEELNKRWLAKDPNGEHGFPTVNLGGMAMVRLVIGAGGSHLAQDILAVHGETIGGGRTKGGSINAVSRLRDVARANFYLAGHNHDQQAAPGQVLRLKDNAGKIRVSNENMWYVRTGGYRKGYIDGEETAFKDNYIAKGHYCPAVLGTPELKIVPVRRKKGAERRFFVESTVSLTAGQ